ncbi:acriflavin resistance protein [Enterovibrio norvegicus FF-33]|uniref:efflux RND transporter permease subunit n=1 Tax=Enterovibrio TaxID=188143 RepID=UPI00030414CE|nr:efflux RND transporter permease subunit [Enterovibrio norvegicus]OEE70933.1 acriflavin resistance protein [Enterovibrio norvegicus FF-33]OEE74406.1 acriflavin resistance protein [Enterovibrio norvegicus FF-162]
MIRFFARHPTAANLLMLTLILLGLTSLSKLKRETFPEFAPPYILANVVYPGASPEQVEQNICLLMEEAVDGLSNIEETRCEAVEGSASLVVKLNAEADISRMLVDIQTQINAVNNFPSDIEPPVVRELDWNEPVVDVAIAAETDWVGLKAYAEDLKQKLKHQYDVQLVNVAGFSDKQIRIEVRESAIRQLGLSVEDIAAQISAQNINLPSGNVELADKSLLIRFDQRRIATETLGQIVVAADSEGGVIRLQDIATLTERFELDEQKVWFDGKPSALLKISKNKADDALRIKERVVQFVDDQQAIAPAGVTLNLTNDFSSLLWDRLTMMTRNAWQGVILVFGVMWLFFSFRYSFWVAAGLPVAFLGSFFLMAQLGLSINIMSLVALLMAIGIMMDDAIVISESIASHIDRGQKLEDAVVNGVKKVLPGVVSSYLTTVCIFGSLIFLQGEMGAVLRVVPMVLILVLTLSLVEAFLILPHHLQHSLSKAGKPKPDLAFKRKFLEKFEHFRANRLAVLVTKAVEWRYAFVGGVLAMLLISFALLASGAVRFVGFPELDGDIAEARVILPPGSSLAQTESVVATLIESANRVSERLSEENEQGQPLIEHITEQFNFNADADESGQHIATVRIDLLSAEMRETLIDDFAAEWEKETGMLTTPISLVFKQPAMGPGGRDFDIRLQHDDLDELKQASVQIQQFIGQFEGVSGVLDDMRPGKEEVKVTLRPGAETFGINGQMIARQLRAAYFGQTADEIQVGPESIEVDVRLDKDDASSLQGLANFPIVLPDGSLIPLSTVAELNYQRNYVRIQRIDGLRTLSVFGDVVQSQVSIGDVLARLKEEIVPGLETQYPGLRVLFEGQSQDSAETGRSMGIGFALGLFGIFVILSFQFRSYLEPFVVLIAIPLALIGVLWGHWLLGHPLSMPSMMGFVSLAGVVVNDSILLVQYIRHHLDEGDDVYSAVVRASQERFRAVFLTSLTTAAGLLPLMLETSLQAQVVKPLVISIVFGIFTSTLLVLFMIPAAYAILADFGKVKRHEPLHAPGSV